MKKHGIAALSIGYLGAGAAIAFFYPTEQHYPFISLAGPTFLYLLFGNAIFTLVWLRSIPEEQLKRKSDAAKAGLIVTMVVTITFALCLYMGFLCGVSGKLG